MTDFDTLTAHEQNRLREALRALPGHVRLADVDWSAVLAAIRPGLAPLDLSNGTVHELLTQIDRGKPDYRALMERKLNAMAERTYGSRWREIIAERWRAMPANERREMWCALERFQAQFRNSRDQAK